MAQDGSRPDAAPQPSGAPAASPVAPPTPAAHARAEAAAVQLPVPVPAAHAVEAMHDLIELARSRDATHARLILHPADLGGVEVRLSHGADGLRATVSVEHPEALQILERGLGDLRRSLEARGVTVAGLDLGLAADQRDRRPESRGDGFTAGTSRISPLDGGDADGDDLFTPTATTHRISAGALVDVMA
jgi:hypothetical protein